MSTEMKFMEDRIAQSDEKARQYARTIDMLSGRLAIIANLVRNDFPELSQFAVGERLEPPQPREVKPPESA